MIQLLDYSGIHFTDLYPVYKWSSFQMGSKKRIKSPVFEIYYQLFYNEDLKPRQRARVSDMLDTLTWSLYWMEKIFWKSGCWMFGFQIITVYGCNATTLLIHAIDSFFDISFSNSGRDKISSQDVILSVIQSEMCRQL